MSGKKDGNKPPEGRPLEADEGKDLENGSGDELDEDQEADSGERTDADPTTKRRCPKKTLTNRPGLIAALIILIGIAACAIILGFGITVARQEQHNHFEKLANEFFHDFEEALGNFVVGGLWLHQACRTRKISHHDFREAYEYLLSSGLEFRNIAFAMNVTSNAERQALENETRAYLQETHPNFNYSGFLQIQPDPVKEGTTLLPQPSNHSFYYPVHYVEPVEKFHPVIDADIYRSPARQKALLDALNTWKPAMTKRLKLTGHNVITTDPNTYSVILMHPGIPLPSRPHVAPRDVSVLAIDINHVLTRAHRFAVDKSISVYVFDSTDTDDAPVFLGGARVPVNSGSQSASGLTFLPDRELSDLSGDAKLYKLMKRLPAASREWTFAVVASEDDFQPELVFVILGATMIFVACICLALWVYTNYKRVVKVNEMSAAAEAEKATIMVDSARRATKAERELNDFIAHEVRNPLAAAISACSFVSAAVDEATPLADAESRTSVREDIKIIDNSLQFINDLLRNMLDMHRASSKQLNIELSPVGLLSDILEPVASMLYRRHDEFEVLIDCPQDLVVKSDRLRLKQTLLNLGRNSAKFTEKGFIRLRASTDEYGHVCLYVEDSGRGIPVEKRDKLFAKFQESLDSMNQGTGIGLCLCKNLVELMGGRIWLDESYDSGLHGCPGTRFVVDLNTSALSLEDHVTSATVAEMANISKEFREEDRSQDIASNAEDVSQELPESFSVLFVDDDFILRKLFARAVKRITSDWQVQEAANGETALRLVDSQDFDLIFIDQYMASVNRQLLGTETTRALRAKGVTSTICGLSANDLEQPFLKSGADAFMMKPFPCEEEALKDELLRVIEAGHNAGEMQAIK